MEHAKTGNETMKIVVAQLDREEYGLSVAQVESLVRVPEITRVPGLPSFVEGVMNLRGRIIPVLDLRKRLQMPAREWADKTRIALVDLDAKTVGMVVDSVSDVINIKVADIEPVPDTISQSVGAYMTGIAKHGDRLILLLDLEKVLSAMERTELQQLPAAEPEAGR